MTLTPELRRIEADERVLVVVSSFEEAALELGLLEPQGLERAPARAAAGGRGITRLIALGSHPQRLHLRPVHHGGLLGGILGRWLVGLARPLAELEVAIRLRARGAPVAQAVLVLGRRAWGLWRADVGTVYEEQSIDGEAFLRAAPSQGRMLRAARAAGSAVRRLHDAFRAYCVDENRPALRRTLRAVNADLVEERFPLSVVLRVPSQMQRAYRDLFYAELTDDARLLRRGLRLLDK